MPCGPICPASDALCIAGFKTGWRLWPPTRASFPGRGQATQKKTHRRRLKVTNRIWYSWGKGCPPFSFPPSLVSVAQFSFFPQLYQIQLVLATLRLAAKDGPPDINSPNVHVKTEGVNNIDFTSFSLVSTTKFAPFPQPYQIQLVSHHPPETDQGGSEPLTSRHRPWIA